MPTLAKNSTPRIKIIQKLYSKVLNPDEKIIYNKSHYKKFIKDVDNNLFEDKRYTVSLNDEILNKLLKSIENK